MTDRLRSDLQQVEPGPDIMSGRQLGQSGEGRAVITYCRCLGGEGRRGGIVPSRYPDGSPRRNGGMVDDNYVRSAGRVCISGLSPLESLGRDLLTEQQSS